MEGPGIRTARLFGKDASEVATFYGMFLIKHKGLLTLISRL